MKKEPSCDKDQEMVSEAEAVDAPLEVTASPPNETPEGPSTEAIMQELQGAQRRVPWVFLLFHLAPMDCAV